jgi:hypothetical protein
MTEHPNGWSPQDLDALYAAYDAAPAAPLAPVTKSAPATPAPAYGPLAEAVREMFRRERAARAALERRIESLERELAATRAELGVERRVGNMLERLQRLEAASGTTLRNVG